MRKILFFGLMAFCSRVSAQYYYSDILSTKQTNQQYKLLRSFQYKKINAVSFDGDQPSKDFVLEQSIANDGSKIMTKSASIGNTESYFTAYYQNNRVVRTVDSGNNAINTIAYQYDNSGKVTAINYTSKDFDGKFSNNESHVWSYNENGLPEKMLKVKNQYDTTWVTFTYDDDNVAEERWQKNNRNIETYYYYYNPKKLLTDIVRFNRKAKTMLPDYIFEYDTRGHVLQMTQTQSGSANYLVWKYDYNENGMKEKEVVYNKQRELLGRIEYKYQ